ARHPLLRVAIATRPDGRRPRFVPTDRASPLRRAAADPELRTASFDRGSGTFTVPPRSVAVFVQR
ncbi:DUF3372 domain-containing protein, partial [Micromonospora sp. DH15]|nr:DUF3372 domain-containing protein [Micromonospora sp. DH15]